MTRPFNTVCHASRSQFTKQPRSAHVWISDELLCETFNTFTRAHKRHGSNVPGPLEAQRRAAKRRTTSIAHSTAYNPGLQSIELFGARPKNGWWDRPVASERDSVQDRSWLWSFLSPPTVPNPVYASSKSQRLDIPTDVTEISKCKTVEERLLERLTRIRSQEALMSLLADLSIDLKQKPYLAQAMLKHILAHHWDPKQVSDFLLEPRTNPPGSGNHAYLFQHFQEHRSIALWLIRRKVYSTAAQLGLLDVKDLQTILLLAPSLRLDSFTRRPEEATCTERKFAWASFSRDLLSATKASKVVSLKDFGHSFVMRWCQLIESQDFQPDMPQLLWHLYGFLETPERARFQRVLHQSIHAISVNNLCYLPKLVDFALSRPGKDVVEALLPITMDLVSDSTNTPSSPNDAVHHRDAELFRQTLTTTVLKYREQYQTITSQQVMEHNFRERNDQITSDGLYDYSVIHGSLQLDRSPSNLEKWYAFLSVLNTPSCQSLTIDQRFCDDSLCKEQSKFQAQQLFVMKLWICTALSEHSYQAVEGLGKLSNSTLSSLFSPEGGTDSEDMTVGLLLALRSLPLPAKHKVLRCIGYLSRGLLVVKRNYADLLKCMDDLHNGHVLSLRDADYYRMACFHFPALLTKVVESMNVDMARFETTCRTLIRESEGGQRLVYRLLKHNRSIQFALRRLSTLTFSYPFRWNDKEAAHERAVGDYSYNQVVDMINNFAIECAKSPILSPRNALREVYFYYQHLHRYRAPIKPAILEALWISGVMRYSGASSMTVVSWLYTCLVQYMGKDLAKLFLDRTILHDSDTRRRVAVKKRIREQELKMEQSEDTSQTLREPLRADISPAKFQDPGAGYLTSGITGQMISSPQAHAGCSELPLPSPSCDNAADSNDDDQLAVFQPMQMIGGTEGYTVSPPCSVTEPNFSSGITKHPVSVTSTTEEMPSLITKVESIELERTLPNSGQTRSTFQVLRDSKSSSSELQAILCSEPHSASASNTIHLKQVSIKSRFMSDASVNEPPRVAPEQSRPTTNRVIPGIDGSQLETVTPADEKIHSKHSSIAPHSLRGDLATAATGPNVQPFGAASLIAMSTRLILQTSPQPTPKLSSKTPTMFNSEPTDTSTTPTSGLSLDQALCSSRTIKSALLDTANDDTRLSPRYPHHISNKTPSTTKTSHNPARSKTNKTAKETPLVRYHDTVRIRARAHDLPGTGPDVPVAETDKYAGYRDRIQARVIHKSRFRAQLKKDALKGTGEK